MKRLCSRYISYAADTPSDKNPEVPVECLNTLDIPGLPPFELSLNKNMPIMLMRNINKKWHLCNGTHLIVQKVSSCLLYATNPARNNEQVVLPRIVLESDIDRVGILWKRRQFPVSGICTFNQQISRSNNLGENRSFSL